MKLSAALFSLSTISVALADTCQKVVPMDKLNVTEYIRSSWYIQEQQLTGYQQPKDLFCVVATYDERKDKKPWGTGKQQVLSVYNNANEDKVNGKVMNPKGNIFNTLCARVPDKDKASELLVAPCFLPNFLAGPYWVLATGSDKDGGRPWEYTWAIVSGGQPTETVEGEDGCCTTKETGVNGSGLWLFSRDPVASEKAMLEMKSALAAQGLCKSKLRKVAQEGCTYEKYTIKPNQ